MFKKYREYLKDNPQGYWFKRKLYGWGWTPAKWQGWAVLVIFIALFVLDFLRIDAVSHSTSDTVRPVIIQAIILVLILIFICYKKGEKPKWQWGIPDKSETENKKL